ncbi:MAG TPA: SHOCT domain-containing protein [Roseiarcus sp.]|nr:SHOCT domain-containing protein [Roseiarcus sp.]
MMWGSWGYGHGWGTPFFGVGHLLSLAIIVGVIYFLFRQDGPLRGRFPDEQADSARDILDRRYARGELTKEQYDQMKRDLGQMP